ncbi:hypothetical protein ACFVJS_03795 [Nocardioides sp. NPDC057772]|uniref:phage tail tube protein n=1 Tax=Nocardioides sp. NPDC057772 TaxID=3346245 RepID=UPI00366F5F97
MTLLPMPPAEKAYGNVLYKILTAAPAAASGIPTLVEVNAGLSAGLYMYGDPSLRPNQNTGEGPRRVAAKAVPTEFGTVTYPPVDVQISFKPQELGTPGADGNEAYEALEIGSEVTVVVFYGIDGRTATVPANAVGDVFLMEIGDVKGKGRTGDGEFDHLSTMLQMVVQGEGPIKEDHVFAA